MTKKNEVVELLKKYRGRESKLVRKEVWKGFTKRRRSEEDSIFLGY